MSQNQNLPDWANVYKCLSDDARKCLILAYELGSGGQPFDVGDGFLEIFDGLDTLGFVGRGYDDATELPTNQFLLMGAGFYCITALREKEKLDVKNEDEKAVTPEA
jgi:hypothetical protein